ncbi:MAG TPA: ATP-binding protein, partial [Thermomicrobiaceae bacterium]|nr:ATP-binding protein [Thermomicrobiaceae bacterium]
ERVVVPDIRACDFLAGTAGLAAYVQAGIHAAQSTPLFSRGGSLLGMISTHWREPHEPAERDLQLLDVLARQAADLIERRHAEAERAALLVREREARTEAETLVQVGQALSGELELEALIQAATDAATQLSGAQFGAFFYNVVNQQGESYMLYTLSGVPRAAFAGYPMPRNTSLFGVTFRGEGIVRIDDVRADPRFGRNAPYFGLPPGHLPVVSFLAVPVISRSGEVLGGLFFGHAEPGMFTERAERLVTGIAAQAAIAIDNARLFEQAQQALHARDAFLAAAAHDLKSPLTTVKGLSQLLRRRVSGSGELDTARLLSGLATIDAGVTTVAAQIDELQDVARLQLGQPLSLQRQPTDLVLLARQAAATHRLPAGHHRIQVEAAEAALVGQWDPVRLKRVLDNLLGNAVKYSPDGGAITVTVTREADAAGDRAMLAVRDQGLGIPAADLPRVFERFHRGTNVSSQIAGSGIGLTSARWIVQQHGGSIAVESREGAGSTFTVRLPLEPPNDGTPDAREPAG